MYEFMLTIWFYNIQPGGGGKDHLDAHMMHDDAGAPEQNGFK